MAMSKEKKAAYDKVYKAANKEKIRASNKAYREANKAKLEAYYLHNRQELLDSFKDLRESEGIGVYKAVYPSGIYIGSGQIYSRRNKHTKGHSRISKRLDEKAVSFEVLLYTDTLEDARGEEQRYINSYDLNNLLNTNNVGGCNNGT